MDVWRIKSPGLESSHRRRCPPLSTLLEELVLSFLSRSSMTFVHDSVRHCHGLYHSYFAFLPLLQHSIYLVVVVVVVAVAIAAVAPFSTGHAPFHGLLYLRHGLLVPCRRLLGRRDRLLTGGHGRHDRHGSRRLADSSAAR